MAAVPPHHDPACWGCGDNPHGLHLPQPSQEGIESYEAVVTFGEHHQAGPGIVHGGLVAAALDEASGLLATWHRFPAVTARIFVRFRRPALINHDLTVAAWVTGPVAQSYPAQAAADAVLITGGEDAS